MDFNNDSGTLSNVSVISSEFGNVAIQGSGALSLPSGSTAQRPVLSNGQVRFNTDTGFVEVVSNGVWVNIRDTIGLPSGGGAGSILIKNSAADYDASFSALSVALTGDVTAPSTDLSAGTLTTTLSNSGVTVGTYGSSSQVPVLTVDAKGRLTAVANVSVGISTLSDTTITSPTVNNVLAYDGTKWVNQGSTTPNSASGILNSWTRIGTTSRYYQDFAHNLATNDLVISTYNNSTNAIVNVDSIVETNTNTVRVTVVGNSVAVRIVVIANGLTVAPALSNVEDSLQVINAGGAISIQEDSLSNRPAAGITGRLFFATDSKLIYRDNGTSWDVIAAGAGGVITSATYYANSVDSPITADYAINAIAPAISDSINSALNVRSFSNSVEQGISLLVTPPIGSVTMNIKTVGRAATAPASAAVVQPRFYIRAIPNNIAFGAWSSATNLTAIPIPTNVFYQNNTQPFSLSSLGMTTGTTYQLEMTRRVSGVTGGTNLAYPWLLLALTIEFL